MLDQETHSQHFSASDLPLISEFPSSPASPRARRQGRLHWPIQERHQSWITDWSDPLIPFQTRNQTNGPHCCVKACCQLWAMLHLHQPRSTLLSGTSSSQIQVLGRTPGTPTQPHLMALILSPLISASALLVTRLVWWWRTHAQG